jgi:glucosamine--fructose-6-phosphate aminotransferase (isomerizing)
MKQSPNPLIDEELTPVLATHDAANPESRLHVQEVKARDGIVVAVVTEGDNLIRKAGAADHVIEIPAPPDLLMPILEILPLQLLVYHIAVRRGCDADQPRNLAKSVTVA